MKVSKPHAIRDNGATSIATRYARLLFDILSGSSSGSSRTPLILSGLSEIGDRRSEIGDRRPETGAQGTESL